MIDYKDCTEEQKARITQALEVWCKWIEQFRTPDDTTSSPYTPQDFLSGDGSVSLAYDSHDPDVWEMNRMLHFLGSDGDEGGLAYFTVWFTSPHLINNPPEITHFVYEFDGCITTIVKEDP